jgi:hypothetical protein
MASKEWVTEAQARQLPRDYGASPDEIEREIARDYRGATDQSAGHELGEAITDAPASAVEEAAVAAYGAANPLPESPAAEELAGALHDELADELDQARARLAAGDVPEVDRPAHEAQIELLEAELAGDETILEQLARGGGGPVLAAKTAAWLAAEAAATQRWIAAETTRQQKAGVGVAPSAAEQEEITATSNGTTTTATAPVTRIPTPATRFRSHRMPSRREKPRPLTRSPPPIRPSRTPDDSTLSGPSRGRSPTGWLPMIMPGLSVTRSSLGAMTRRSRPPESGDETTSPPTTPIPDHPLSPAHGRVRTTLEAPDGT